MASESAPLGGKKSFVGDFTLNYIDIRSPSFQDNIDITQLYTSMEIDESIYNPFITIKVTFMDTSGLMDYTRMTGEEVLVVDVRRPDNEPVGLVGHVFHIYKIANRELMSDRGILYDVYGISISALGDINNKISKAYVGQPSAIVKEIYTHFFKSDKPIFIEETKTAVQYISNYWNPIKNIKFLCDRAISRETNSPSYVFFEGRNSYVFSSLNRLIMQPSKKTYFFTNNLRERDSFYSKSKIVENYYVDSVYDNMERAKTGAFGTRSLMIDPLSKTYQYKYHDFYDSYIKNARLNPRVLLSKEFPRSQHTRFQQRVAPSNSFQSMPDDNASQWFVEKDAQYANIELQSSQINVPGDFDLNVGNVIDYYVYSSRIVDKNSDMYNELDKTFSGRYLVTSIKHFIDRERHVMYVQINKDSLFLDKKK